MLLQHPCNTDLYSDVVAGTAVVVSIIIIQAAALASSFLLRRATGTYRWLQCVRALFFVLCIESCLGLP